MGKPHCEGLEVYPFLEPPVAHFKKQTNKQELVGPGAQALIQGPTLPLRGWGGGGWATLNAFHTNTGLAGRASCPQAPGLVLRVGSSQGLES